MGTWWRARKLRAAGAALQGGAVCGEQLCRIAIKSRRTVLPGSLGRKTRPQPPPPPLLPAAHGSDAAPKCCHSDGILLLPASHRHGCGADTLAQLGRRPLWLTQLQGRRPLPQQRRCCSPALCFGVSPGSPIPTNPPSYSQSAAEYCERGSLTDVLQAAREDPQQAAQLTWRRRLCMVRGASCGGRGAAGG